MIDEMRLESEGKMVLVIAFGHSISYEDKEQPENSFDCWWKDLWPEQMEAIRQCPVWADTVGLTFEVLEGMIETYDERYTPYELISAEECPVMVQTCADIGIARREQHCLNH